MITLFTIDTAWYGYILDRTSCQVPFSHWDNRRLIRSAKMGNTHKIDCSLDLSGFLTLKNAMFALHKIGFVVWCKKPSIEVSGIKRYAQGIHTMEEYKSCAGTNLINISSHFLCILLL